MNEKDLEDKIKELESRIRDLEELPFRCEVCGKPTDGYIRVLFWTHYYCKEHYPPSIALPPL